MSTQHKERDKTQETSQQDSQSIYTANTIQQEQVSHPPSVPQFFQRPPRTKKRRWFVLATVIAILVLILGGGSIAIALLAQHSASQVTVTPTPNGTDTKPSQSPGVASGPQKGPASVSDPAYWNPILGTQ